MRSHKCKVCDRTLKINQFPLRHIERGNCNHSRDTCKSCWQDWLKTRVDGSDCETIACVQTECNNELGQVEVAALATRDTYASYLDRTLRSSLSKQANFLWCLNPACKSGHEHIGGDIFTCHECGHKACANCQTDWHAGETCADHQERIRKQNERNEQEVNSAKTLKATSKMCPRCKCKVEKAGGCDHMTCMLCHYEFCWRCLASYRAIFRKGNSSHDLACPHYRGGY